MYMYNVLLITAIQKLININKHYNYTCTHKQCNNNVLFSILRLKYMYTVHVHVNVFSKNINSRIYIYNCHFKVHVYM